jgi:flagellin
MEGVSMVINTNISAQNSARLLSASSTQLSKSLARLSSGSKIVSAADDVAGMAVSMKFDAQINRINAASTNVSNAVSFSQTQDGYLQKVGDALNRMSELTVLAQDVTKSSDDRALYQKEFTSLGQYITDVASKTFNGVTLFSGTTLSVTTDSETGTFSLAGVSLGVGAYTVATGGNISSATFAAAALTNIQAAIKQLSTDRATVGASVSSLTMYGDQLGVLKDNISAANSNIKDVDVAAESTQYARYNILVQAGTAMLAQANTAPQAALRLLS